MKMLSGTVLLLTVLLFLGLAAALPADDYPAPALKAFISKQGNSGWRPKLPEEATLLGLDAAAVLDAIRGKGVYVETEYIRLVSTVPSLKASTKTYPRVRQSLDTLVATYPKFKSRYPVLSRVQFAHLIAFHLERVMAESWRLFGTTCKTYVDYKNSHKLGPIMRQRGKFEVFLFSSSSEYNRFADQFTGRQSMLGQRYRSPSSDALSFLVSPPSGGARALNKWVNLTVNNFAHNILMSEIRNSYRVPMWLDIGFAHWMEQREGFETNTYTFGEAGKKVRFANGDWRPPLRSLVAAGKVIPFDDFFQEQSLGNYSGTMRGLTYGVVDFMIRKNRDGFREFVRLLRDKDSLDLRAAFSQAFRAPPSIFYERWMHWARTKYTAIGLKSLSRDPVMEKD